MASRSKPPSNAGLGATWCAQGKETAEYWGKWMGVEVTWFDGGLSIDTQRKAIDDMAARDWDFVAIQAFGIDTLVDPVSQMIEKGIPVIQMDRRSARMILASPPSLSPITSTWGPLSPKHYFSSLVARAR
ncbi:MAG: substrate-binding domain-containing protein [Caldilineaceae bacterium]